MCFSLYMTGAFTALYAVVISISLYFNGLRSMQTFRACFWSIMEIFQFLGYLYPQSAFIAYVLVCVFVVLS